MQITRRSLSILCLMLLALPAQAQKPPLEPREDCDWQELLLRGRKIG